MKTQIKHTPGPWELSEGDTSVWATSPLNARVRIADIRQHSPLNGIDNKANARLIAAAPELLNIAKDYLYSLDARIADLKEQDENPSGFDDNLGDLIAELQNEAGEVREVIYKAGGK